MLRTYAFILISLVVIGSFMSRSQHTGNQSLLGQSFLNRFASVTIQGDKMVLR